LTRKRLLISLTVVVVALAAAAVFIYQRLQTDSVVLAIPSGELTFISDRNGTWDIFVLDTEGILYNLTADGDDQDYFASWSFQSDMINFLSSRSGEMGPAQVRPDGTDLKTLTIAEAVTTVLFEGRVDWDPAWSPGAEKLGWSSLRDFNLELYLSDPDGENRQRITRDAGRDWFMSWSPDGEYFTFSSDRAGNEDVYKYNLTDESMTRLTDNPADDIHAVWSLDGERILFVSERENGLVTGQLDIYLMEPDGSQQRPLDDEIFEGDPTYNADGSQVAFMSNESGTWSIYVMDADGGNVRRLTGDESNDLFPVWRPVAVD
jgi:Tol biopolymer transport system component